MRTFAMFMRPVMSDGSLQRDEHDGWRFSGFEDDLNKVLEAETACEAENGKDSFYWSVLDREKWQADRKARALRPDIATPTQVDPEEV